MISNIASGPVVEPKEQDAVDLLLACHSRIRNFTAIAHRLASVKGAAPAEVANAAEAVHRYYTVALPLHEADENETVYPRLRSAMAAAGAPPASVEAMVEQHGPIDDLVAELVPLWARLQSSPERLSDVAPEMAAKCARLQQLWNEHLALEEETVFPAIRVYIDEAGLRAMKEEMRARRE
jgi:hemerythrin-like domain-containing protein